MSVNWANASTPKDHPVSSSSASSPLAAEFLNLRDSDFERRRIEFFSDPNLLSALREFDPRGDSVKRFIVRNLLLWADESPPRIAAIEHYFEVEAPAFDKANIKAGAVNHAPNVLGLVFSQKDPEQGLDYLLLRALTRPNESHYALSAMSQWNAKQPGRNPDVWIRIAVEWPYPEMSEYVVDYVLRHIPKTTARRLLNAERVRLLRKGAVLPKALEQYRLRLSK